MVPGNMMADSPVTFPETVAFRVKTKMSVETKPSVQLKLLRNSAKLSLMF